MTEQLPARLLSEGGSRIAPGITATSRVQNSIQKRLPTCLSMCAAVPGTVNDSMPAAFSRCWILAIACARAGGHASHLVTVQMLPCATL